MTSPDSKPRIRAGTASIQTKGNVTGIVKERHISRIPAVGMGVIGTVCLCMSTTLGQMGGIDLIGMRGIGT